MSDPPPEFRKELLALLPQLRKYAHKMFPTVWEDLTQDVFVRAWTKWETFQPGSNMKSWLFTIMWNQWKSSARRESRMEPRDPRDFYRDNLGERNDALPVRVETATQQIYLEFEEHRAVLDRMSGVLREAAVLRDLQGYSEEEAAAIAGVPIGTIKSRLSRARARYASI